MSLLLNGYRILVLDDEKVLEIDCAVLNAMVCFKMVHSVLHKFRFNFFNWKGNKSPLPLGETVLLSTTKSFVILTISLSSFTHTYLEPT